MSIGEKNALYFDGLCYNGEEDGSRISFRYFFSRVFFKVKKS